MLPWLPQLSRLHCCIVYAYHVTMCTTAGLVAVGSSSMVSTMATLSIPMAANVSTVTPHDQFTKSKQSLSNRGWVAQPNDGSKGQSFSARALFLSPPPPLSLSLALCMCVCVCVRTCVCWNSPAFLRSPEDTCAMLYRLVLCLVALDLEHALFWRGFKFGFFQPSRSFPPPRSWFGSYAHDT